MERNILNHPSEKWWMSRIYDEPQNIIPKNNLIKKPPTDINIFQRNTHL
jgi:hypothetical protein